MSYSVDFPVVTCPHCQCTYMYERDEVQKAHQIVNKAVKVKDLYHAFSRDRVYDRHGSAANRYKLHSHTMTTHAGTKTLFEDIGYWKWKVKQGYETEEDIQPVVEELHAIIKDGLNQQDIDGRTPVIRAAAQRDSKVLKALIRMGADLRLGADRKDELPCFLTPLHTAISVISPKCVKMILEQAPDLAQIQDNAGRRAKEWAERRSEDTLYPDQHCDMKKIMNLLGG
ncbi:MAG: hypothetical protein JSR46_02070 [Verrucomicrobia bacterium]|nr:hypothetical protein [Verrucomicrobiota bacterium]